MEPPSTQRRCHEKRYQQPSRLSPPASGKAISETALEKDEGPDL